MKTSLIPAQFRLRTATAAETDAYRYREQCNLWLNRMFWLCAADEATLLEWIALLENWATTLPVSTSAHVKRCMDRIEQLVREGVSYDTIDAMIRQRAL